MSNRSNGKNLGKRSDCLEDYWYSPSNYHKYLIFIEKGVILYHIVQVISRKHGKVPLWKCNWRAQSLRNLSLIAPSRSYTPRHLETATRTINHCYHRNVLEPQREKCFLLKGKQERRGGGVGGRMAAATACWRCCDVVGHRRPIIESPLPVRRSLYTLPTLIEAGYFRPTFPNTPTIGTKLCDACQPAAGHMLTN